MTQDPFHLISDQALGRMPAPDHEQYVVLLEHGTLEVGTYAPKRVDQQTPHTRDEVYVVFRGTGWFRNGPHRTAFAPGDVLFVPARQEHRFEEFTDDFAVWVFFYGPEGGEEVTGSEE
jgi:mannose-6-phosphate isomerase-like protein (cupin superfamily)